MNSNILRVAPTYKPFGKLDLLEAFRHTMLDRYPCNASEAGEYHYPSGFQEALSNKRRMINNSINCLDTECMKYFLACLVWDTRKYLVCFGKGLSVQIAIEFGKQALHKTGMQISATQYKVLTRKMIKAFRMNNFGVMLDAFLEI